MKRYRIIIIAAVIAAIAAVITGCTGGGGESSAPGASSAAGQKLAYLTDELPHYDTVTALRGAATDIFEGTVKEIYFEAGKSEKDGIDAGLRTVYRIDPESVYKHSGYLRDDGDEVLVYIPGGLAGYNEDAQCEALRNAGMYDEAAGIPVYAQAKPLEVGGKYLFFAAGKRNTCRRAVNIDQFAFNTESGEKSGGFAYSDMVSVTNPGSLLNKEQKAKLAEVRAQKMRFAGTYFFEEAVILGKTDSSQHIKNIDTVRDIIKRCGGENARIEDVLDAIAEIQPYPDCEWGSGLSFVEYWLDEDGSEYITCSSLREYTPIYYVHHDQSSGEVVKELLCPIKSE